MYDGRCEGQAVRPYRFGPLGAGFGERHETDGDPRGTDPWEQKRQEVYRAGFQEGQKAGLDQGLEQGIARAGEVAERLENLIRSLTRGKEQACQRCHREMLELSVRIAEKIVHRELRSNPAERLEVVAEGLKKLQESQRILIRTSPADYELLQGLLPGLCERNGITGVVALREDPGIAEGGCVLEGDHGQVDARLEQMLQTVQEALLPS